MGGRGGASHIAAGAGGGASIQVPAELKDAKKFLTDAFGKKYLKSIMGLLVKAPDHVRAMWERLAKNFRYAGLSPGSARYSPMEDAVRLDIEKSMAGTDYQPPHQVLFHEFGHMADYLIQRIVPEHPFGTYSENYKGGLLGRTAKQEVAALVNSYMAKGMDRDHAVFQIMVDFRAKYTKMERYDLSDMLEGGGLGWGYPLGAGHGMNYWLTRDNGKEIFAEITSAEIANPGSLATIQAVLPETYRVYTEMVTEWWKNGAKKK